MVWYSVRAPPEEKSSFNNFIETNTHKTNTKGKYNINRTFIHYLRQYCVVLCLTTIGDMVKVLWKCCRHYLFSPFHQLRSLFDFSEMVSVRLEWQYTHWNMLSLMYIVWIKQKQLYREWEYMILFPLCWKCSFFLLLLLWFLHSILIDVLSFVTKNSIKKNNRICFCCFYELNIH